MSIQGNLNQAVSLASLLASQSGTAKNRQEGLSIQAKGVSAQKGLENIHASYKELEAGNRAPYSETEIADIESRIGQLNKNIYDAIITAEDPKLGKYIDKSKLGDRATRSAMLNELSNFRNINQSRIEMVKNATQSAKEGLTAKRMEQSPSKEFVKQMAMPIMAPTAKEADSSNVERINNSILERPSKTVLEKPSSTKVIKPSSTTVQKPSSTTVEKPKLKTDEFVVVEKPETTTIKR